MLLYTLFRGSRFSDTIFRAITATNRVRLKTQTATRYMRAAVCVLQQIFNLKKDVLFTTWFWQGDLCLRFFKVFLINHFIKAKK